MRKKGCLDGDSIPDIPDYIHLESYTNLEGGNNSQDIRLGDKDRTSFGFRSIRSDSTTFLPQREQEAEEAREVRLF